MQFIPDEPVEPIGVEGEYEDYDEDVPTVDVFGLEVFDLPPGVTAEGVVIVVAGVTEDGEMTTHFRANDAPPAWMLRGLLNEGLRLVGNED